MISCIQSVESELISFCFLSCLYKSRGESSVWDLKGTSRSIWAAVRQAWNCFRKLNIATKMQFSTVEFSLL